MKVLIVDDDINTVDAIRRSLDWEKLEIGEVCYAYEIAGAKKILTEESIDIVVCDIEMPMGSGLDLIQWTREHHISSEFLFLTCHESFEFAVYAMRYEAAAYLTKPFVPEKLEQELYKLISKIGRKQELLEAEKYRELWTDSEEYIRYGFWRDLLLEQIPAQSDYIERELHRRRLLLEDGSWILLVASSRKYENAWEEWNADMLEYALQKLGCEILEGKEEGVNILHESTEDMFCMMKVYRQEQRETAEQAGAELIRLCDRWFGCGMTCYLTGPAGLEELAQFRKQILKYDVENMMQRGRVLTETQWQTSCSGEKITMDLQGMEQYLIEGDQIRIMNYLKKLLEQLMKSQQLNASALLTLQTNVTQIVYVYLYKNGIRADELFHNDHALKLRNKAQNSAVDFLKWTNYLLQRTREYIQEIQESDNVIYTAKHYITEHYTEDIGRSQVAAAVYLTPEYLAKIFKRSEGINLKDYIYQLRIQEARRLLMAGARVSEVAQLVGFDNFAYFSTIFKKVTGMRPNEYKKAGERTKDESTGIN